MQGAERPKRIRKKECSVRVMLDTNSQKEDMENLLRNIKARNGRENGVNTIEALKMYNEALKVKR